jgi:hypothetical protein
MQEVPGSRHADDADQYPEPVEQRVSRILFQHRAPRQQHGIHRLTSVKLEIRIITPMISIVLSLDQMKPLIVERIKAHLRHLRD